ncbi:MAG: hypothetical protein ACYDH5_07775 [Acidimicrobiales bacterium]
MAWCEECEKLAEPEDLGRHGECPDCGSVIGEARPVPWHFKVLVVLTVLYLGFRLAQGVVWLAQHL